MDKKISLPTSRIKSDESFEEFIGPYMDYLYSLSYRLTGHKTKTENLMNHVLIKVFEQWRGMENLEQPHAWLSRVTHHTSIDVSRNKSNYSHFDHQDITEPQGHERPKVKVILSRITDTLGDAEQNVSTNSFKYRPPQ